MTCAQFNRLGLKAQLQYLYDHCRLIDFMFRPGAAYPDAVCLYYDGETFVEVRFDGLQGDRVKEISSYPTIQQLKPWYDPVDVSVLFQNIPKN